MSIQRSTPNIDYSQTVRANDTVYFSGIVAARGMGEPAAPGDMAGQIDFILGVLGRLLAVEGLSFASLASVTVYSPALDLLLPHLGLFARAFAGHPPTFQVFGVSQLPSPNYLLELVAIASISADS
jgi:enamine deaminase RidA (YjgF/YER057c/UK114 family)